MLKNKILIFNEITLDNWRIIINLRYKIGFEVGKKYSPIFHKEWEETWRITRQNIFDDLLIKDKAIKKKVSYNLFHKIELSIKTHPKNFFSNITASDRSTDVKKLLSDTLEEYI